MRPFSTRLYPSTITVRRRTDSGSDDRGGESAVFESPGTSMYASVLAMSATGRDSHRIESGVVTGDTAWIVRTATDPGVTTDDRLDWLSRTLLVVTGARPTAFDSSGTPVAWATECMERT